MRILNSSKIDQVLNQRNEVCNFASLTEANRVLEKVKRDGDMALRSLAQSFNEGEVQIFSRGELKLFWDGLPFNVRQAIEVSIANVKKYHSSENPKQSFSRNQSPINLYQKLVPISSVGVYVPNGLAPLPSSLIMGAVPARVAGVPEVIATFASGLNGPSPLLMGAAFAAEVDRVVTVGGPQAIAALALGTEIVPKVDFICGPGGQRVTATKALVSAMGLVGIDMLAGPSEVCIISDGTVPLRWTAADLLSQLEHGPSSIGYLLVTNEPLARKIGDIVKELIVQKNINASLDQVQVILVKDLWEAVDVANLLAPEHLLLQTENAEELLNYVISAGSVFLGGNSSEVYGDYASGSNHILPTSGQARIRGGLSVLDFLKTISVQNISSEAVQELGPIVELLAAQEGLKGHAYASEVRRLCK